MPLPTIEERRAEVQAFGFHQVHPQLRFGTASDRYAGWIGQIYSEHWLTETGSRNRTLADAAFKEETLPIASVQEYFQHLSTLELDFTFYRPLLAPNGNASPNLHILQQYAEHAPPNARFLVKAPQQFFARILRKGKKGEPVRYEANPDFLNAKHYTERFHLPLMEVLGGRVAGILFQQEYQQQKSSPIPNVMVEEFKRFFQEIPNDATFHIELRSEHLLLPPYFDFLEAQGIGFAFSHWTYLPPLRRQWELCRRVFSASDGHVFLRLLTPRQMPYADAYKLAFPFTKPVPELSQTPAAHEMINEATALAYHAIQQGKTLHVIANNRAWGNSPSLNQAVAQRFLDFAARKGA